MLTEKDYCDYETCVALKELGYIGQGRHYYNLDKAPNELKHFGVQVLTTRSAEALNFVLAVHLYDAQKWLREEKRLFVEVVMSYGKYDFDICSTKLEQNMTHKILCEICGYETYEEALSEGIKEAVKILKEK